MASLRLVSLGAVTDDVILIAHLKKWRIANSAAE